MKITNETTIKNIPDYVSYPKKFANYRWFKPLLTMLLSVGFTVAFTVIVAIVTFVIDRNAVTNALNGSYSTMDPYSAAGAIITFGTVAVILPAIMLANRIVNGRPFSSYSSSRGGFDLKAFFKSFGAAVLLLVLPVALITILTEKNTGNIQFSVAGIILCAVICPIQCIAEEYMCRALVMQAVGSWVKIPIVAIIVQAVVFAVLHPYNLVGVITIFLIGIIYGAMTVITKGVEASCALHIADNMTVFFLCGFGFGAISSEVGVIDSCITVGLSLLYLCFIVFADKRLGWFSKVKNSAAKNSEKSINETLPYAAV